MDFITEYSPQSILNIVEQHPLYEDNGLQITGTAMTLHRPKAKLDRVDSFYVLEELHKSSLLTSLSNSRPKSSGLPTITVSRQRAEPGTPRGPVQLETLDIAKEKRRLTAEKRRRRRRSRRVSPSLSITSSVSELSSHDGSIAESHTEYEQLWILYPVVVFHGEVIEKLLALLAHCWGNQTVSRKLLSQRASDVWVYQVFFVVDVEKTNK